MPVVLDGLAGMAALHAAEGRGQEAWGLLRQILKQPAANRETRDRAERLCAVLEAELTPAQIRGEWASTRQRFRWKVW